jgi:hypothetical protein
LKETTAAGNPIDLRQRHRFPYLRASWNGQFAGVCTYIPGGTGWTPAAVPILIYPVLFSTSVRLAAPTPNPF